MEAWVGPEGHETAEQACLKCEGGGRSYTGTACDHCSGTGVVQDKNYQLGTSGHPLPWEHQPEDIKAEGMSDDEWEDAKEAERLENHPEKDQIKKLQDIVRRSKMSPLQKLQADEEGWDKTVGVIDKNIEKMKSLQGTNETDGIIVRNDPKKNKEHWTTTALQPQVEDEPKKDLPGFEGTWGELDSLTIKPHEKDPDHDPEMPNFSYYRWMKKNSPEEFKKMVDYNKKKKGIPMESKEHWDLWSKFAQLDEMHKDSDYKDPDANCPHDIGKELKDGDWDEFDMITTNLPRIDGYIDKYEEEDEMKNRKGDGRIKDPDEKEVEDAEADDTLQYTGVTHFGTNEDIGYKDYDDPRLQPPDPEWEWPEVGHPSYREAFPEVEFDRMSDDQWIEFTDSPENQDRYEQHLKQYAPDEDIAYDEWQDEQALKKYESQGSTFSLKGILMEKSFKDRKGEYRKIGEVGASSEEDASINDAFKGYPADEYWIRAIKKPNEDKFELYIRKKPAKYTRARVPKDLYDFVDEIVEDEKKWYGHTPNSKNKKDKNEGDY